MPPHVFGGHAAPHPNSRVHRAITAPHLVAANSNDPEPLRLPPSTALERITMAAIVGCAVAFWVVLVWLAVDKAATVYAPPGIACVEPRGQA